MGFLPPSATLLMGISLPLHRAQRRHGFVSAGRFRDIGSTQQTH
jgi:hypothetical protein